MTAQTAAQSASASQYTHAPLNHESDDIRLLNIDSVDDNGTVRCTLRTYPNQARPAYKALSYAWGDGEAVMREIIVNGCSFQVGDNLWHALRALGKDIRISARDYHPESQYRATLKDATLLWVDAICIDQLNVAEKNHQVGRMGAIYSEAALVISWVGKPSSATDGLFEALGTFEAQAVIDEPLFHAINDSLKDIFFRDYWSRVWIIQEFMLAPDVLVLCGDKAFSWYQFTHFLSHPGIPSNKKTAWEQEAAWRLKHPAYTLIQERLTQGFLPDANSLIILFRTFHDRKSSIVHDRIYGLLGLVGSTDPADYITVDYEKSPKQLYLEVMAQFNTGTAWEYMTRFHSMTYPLPSYHEQRLGLSRMLQKALNLEDSQIPAVPDEKKEWIVT